MLCKAVCNGLATPCCDVRDYCCYESMRRLQEAARQADPVRWVPGRHADCSEFLEWLLPQVRDGLAALIRSGGAAVSDDLLTQLCQAKLGKRLTCGVCHTSRFAQQEGTFIVHLHILEHVLRTNILVSPGAGCRGVWALKRLVCPGMHCINAAAHCPLQAHRDNQHQHLLSDCMLAEQLGRAQALLRLEFDRKPTLEPADCDDCGERTKTMQQQFLAVSPSMLLLHVARNEVTNTTNKVRTSALSANLARLAWPGVPTRCGATRRHTQHADLLPAQATHSMQRSSAGMYNPFTRQHLPAFAC